MLQICSLAARRTSFFAALTIIVGGCSSVIPVDVTEMPRTVERVSETNYVVGEPLVSRVGDTMIRVRDYSVQGVGKVSVRANMDFAVRGCMHDVRFTEGQVIDASGSRKVSDGQEVIVVPAAAYQFGMRNPDFAVQVLPDGRLHNRVLSDSIEMVHDCAPDSADARLMLLRSEGVVPDTPYRNYEIRYDGADGQSMRFTYREIASSDLESTAFAQSVTYPVTLKDVRFRDLAIQVSSVAPDSISYAVVSDE